MSGRPGMTEKRLSIHRFQPLPDPPPEEMGNPNDATIDIPLTSVSSRGQTGARKGSGVTPVSTNHYEPPMADMAEQSGEKSSLVAGSGLGSGHGPGRRRRATDEDKGRSLEEPEDGTITRMGRIYQAILNFSIITRYMIYVTPIGLLIAIPIIVGATVAQDVKIGGVALHWFFTWIEVVWLSLWVSKIFAHFVPYVFQFLCGIVSSGTRKYALLLRALEMPLSLVAWLVVSLVTFLPIMTMNPLNKAEGDTSVKSWEKSVKNILFALLVCSLIFLGEKTIVQLISVSYHRKQFDAKIKESKRNIYLVGQLYEASRNMFPMYCKEFRDEDAIISDTFLGAATAKRPGFERSGSGVPLRLIRNVGQNVGRFGDKVTAAFGNVAQELTGKQVFNPTSAHSVVTHALERKKASEALARRIWMSCVIEGREALYYDDILEVLGAGRDADAEECFQILDRDGNGDISLDEMILAVTEFGRSRKALNHSMHDVDQAIHVLDNLLLTVAFIISILVFVSFVTSGFGTVIAAGATSLLSLSFVFSTTAQEVLGSCIFLFVKHPFDVGDRIEVSDKPYVVERISLLFSVFRSVTDHRMTQVPNVVLNGLWIDNFTRANAMHEQLTIPVKFETTFADIQCLKAEMEKFVRDKDNCRDFQPDINIEMVGVGDMDKLQLSVDIRHKSNWSNETVRAARRSKFMCALVLAVRKIPIRAPGADEEAPADDDDNNNNDKPDSDNTNDKTPAAAGPAAASGLLARNGTNASSTLQPQGKSTSIDTTRLSTGTISRRGAPTHETEAAYADQLNVRSPAMDQSRDEQETEPDHYQTPTGSPRNSRQLSVNSGANPLLAREPSTGRRKGGTTPPGPATYAGVPIIARPIPPRLQRMSATPTASNTALNAPQPPAGLFNYPTNTSYYPPQETPYANADTHELPTTTVPLEESQPSPILSSPSGLQVPPLPPAHRHNNGEQMWTRPARE
ncbi:hypothetical protein ASPWEDRAFT_119519 [Aspergillus wentii DTO 134E9]|uniref:EF-hand domain-containing protein n=1 Tax=Aspergillus wentii DTO 134E9 TaxID=1073089 RepID=A0A1L9R888_ASPWE|nr:uncharacterized protein ASPWEDRAFT_119519 [Aspergillus wentii DTO 134E9]KAI9924949.1 hypothetical protein MW887_006356 [Aspergillus wentii]OJJ31114.1 hypothetical protein ASPWEDRAFT_119519 [Aspergillus wentii DTO 134E9]